MLCSPSLAVPADSPRTFRGTILALNVIACLTGSLSWRCCSAKLLRNPIVTGDGGEEAAVALTFLPEQDRAAHARDGSAGTVCVGAKPRVRAGAGSTALPTRGQLCSEGAMLRGSANLNTPALSPSLIQAAVFAGSWGSFLYGALQNKTLESCLPAGNMKGGTIACATNIFTTFKPFPVHCFLLCQPDGPGAGIHPTGL